MLWIWMIYLVATIVYLAPQGYPQHADGFMAIMLIVILTGYFIRPSINRELILCTAPFLTYAAIVNLVWFGIELDRRFVLTALYYPYNVGAVILVASLVASYGWERMADYTKLALGAALVLELVAISLFQGSMHVEEGVIVRSVGTFSNPNQLGYWALCVGSCWMAACGSERLRWSDVAMLGAVISIAAASLSKAAMIGSAVLAVSAIWFQGMSLKLRICTATLCLAGLIAASPQMGAVVERIATTDVAERLANIGRQKDDSAEGRGYDRIWRHPEYLVLGAGEGAYHRFTRSAAAGREMHSTLGTVLYSYGIIGAALFALLLFGVFRRAQLRHFAYTFPLVLYGLTHQGLRTTMLWVFMGLVFSYGISYRSRAAQTSHLAQPSLALSARRDLHP
jgi:hypothetical protein